MNSNNFANTELVLKLGLTSSPSMAENTTNLVKKPSLSPDHRFEPSLTLALSGDSSGGGGSSFSNVSVKREREVASEESNRGAVNIISSEDDEDGGVNARKKLRLSRTQSQLLEQAFKLHTTLNPKQKQELAKELKLRPRQVEVWFQNRRARTKLKQTEIDCEYLKKCYEALMHENRKLRQQVQELKAQPIYMQLPAATLTMCPSCEQIGDSNSGGKGPFTMAPKPQFFNPFATSSAAC